MKFTPSSYFNSLIAAASKYIKWTVSIRITTTLNDALSSGTWIDITSRIEDLPTISQMIEMATGVFTSDSINLTGLGIGWWNDNIFTPADGKYAELKIVLQLGLSSSDLATDTSYEFTGFIDQAGRQESELEDIITMSVLTAEDIGARLAAETISTQYIDPNVDGASTAALILPQIPSLHVLTTRPVGYEMKVGTHTIAYTYDSGTLKHYAAVDGGAQVELSSPNSSYTLANADDTQRCTVYVKSLNDLPQPAASETIIVVDNVTAMPKTWFERISARSIIRKLYAAIGIDTVTFDTLIYNTADGLGKVSYLEVPPADDTIYGERWATATDGTLLFVAVGHKIYSRNMTTHAYTLRATLTAGDKVSKLLYNARNGHLWIFYGSSSEGEGKLRRLVLSGDTLSSEITVANSTRYAIDIMDYEYTAGSWKYSVVYVDNSAKAIKEVSGSSPGAPSTVFTQGDLGYTGSDGPDGNFSFIRTNSSYIVQTSTLTDSYFHKIRVDAAGAWTDEGQVLTLSEGYQRAAFFSSEDRIYYSDVVSSPRKLKSHTYSSATTTDVVTLGTSETIDSLQYLNSKVYFNTSLGRLYEVASNSGTEVSDGVYTNVSSGNVYGGYNTLTFIDTLLYGIDNCGRLWKYGTTVECYAEVAAFIGQSVTEALHTALNSFILTGVIAPNKTAKVYRRGDSSGAAQTSGSILTVTADHIASIQKLVWDGKSCQLAEVDNSVRRMTYDGTTFDNEVLSDARRVSVSSPLIPSNIVPDLAKALFNYFNVDRSKYRVQLALVMPTQYEAFDGLHLTTTGRRISLNDEGPITARQIDRDGTITFETMIED